MRAYSISVGASAILVGTALLNQRVAANDRQIGGIWFEDLGEFTITQTGLVVQLTNVGANGFVIADALRIERVGD